jgi:glyoxylase-like metal-dependent hydrolase (beta-lactamase superfamily II)
MNMEGIGMKVTDTVHCIKIVFVNSYFIIDKEGLTLVDCGMPGNARRIEKALAEAGYAMKDIKNILVTHSDMDHIGSLAELKNLTGAVLYAGAAEAAAIAEGKSSRTVASKGLRGALMGLLKPLIRQKKVRVDRILSGGDMLPIAGGCRAIDTSGHSPGHLSYFLVNEGVLFSGDSAVTGPDAVHGSVPAYTWDADKARNAYLAQASLKPRIVCPGHGPVVMEAAGKFVDI